MAELTSEDVKNLTNAMADFTKAVEKNNKAFLKTETSTKNIAEDINNAQKSLKDGQKNLTGTQKAVAAIKESMADIATSVTGIGKILGAGAIAGFFTNLVKDSIKLDNQMTKLAMQMGKGRGGIKELKGSVNGLQKEFGASYEEARDLVTTLAEAKYVGNIKDAAAAINLFSRATGASAESALQLTDTLSKGAGMSDKAIAAMYAGMTKVQQKVGISHAGMEALTSTIKDAATSMVAMGKSAADIQKVTNNMTALVGALEKVGISAQESTQILDNLLDPDRIEDNILLYSQLGISMEDALSGNIDLTGMDNQLKDMAQRIVDMGPIAGSQFAKSMGMSYKQATQMAKMESGAMDEVADAAQTSEEQALDTLKGLNSETEALFEKANRGLNKIEGVLRGLPGVLLIAMPGVIAKVTDMISNGFKQAFSPKQMSVATEAAVDTMVTSFQKGFKQAFSPKQMSVATEAAVDTMVTSFQKGFEKTEIQARTFLGSFGDALRRTRAGDIETLFTGIDKKTEALVAKAQGKNFTDAFFGANYKNRMDTYLKNFDDLKVKAQSQLKLLSELQTAQDEAKKRDDGKTVARIGNQMTKIKQELSRITGLSVDEFKNLGEATKLVNGLEVSTANIEGTMGVWANKTMKMNEEAAKAKESLEKRSSLLQSLLAQEEERKSAQESIVNLASEIAELEQKAKGATGEAAEILNKQLKEKQEMLGKQNEAFKKLKSEKTLQEEIKRAQELQEKAQTRLNEELEKQNKKLSTAGKLWGGIKNSMSAKWNASNLGKAIAENGGGFKGVAKTAGKGIAKGAVAAGKGTLKAIGGITKMLGPWAIVMALIGKVLDKIKEPLNNLLDNLMVKLQPVLDVIMPIVSELLNTLVKTLFPPLLNILAVILTVLRYILKPVQLILKALSHLPVIGKAFEGVNKSIDQITGPEVVGALKDAANNIANSSENLTQAVDKQTENENKPKVLEADGAKFVQAEAGTTNVPTSPAASPAASSTTTTTKVAKTDEEKAKEANQESREKKQLSAMEDIRDELSDPTVNYSIKYLLAKLVSLLEDKPKMETGNLFSGEKQTASIEEQAMTGSTN